MAHLITSHKGADHVESKHAAHWNAGTLGNGCYVLPIGSKLACTMTDSNTLRVLFGVGSVCGYDWEIEGDYEEVDIDNGVPGYNRIDLLVARVETAPAEKVELRVYKGEETTGTPVQPGYVQGDLNDGDTVCEMPICSVRVNGINPQAPEMLAKESIDIMALLEELRDYKSRAGRRVQGTFTFDSTAPGSISTKTIIFDKPFENIPLVDVCFAGNFTRYFADCHVSVSEARKGSMVIRMANNSEGSITAPVRYQAWLGI